MDFSNYSEKTIAAIATAQAPAGIGIVRISGPDAHKIGDKVFKAKHKKTISNSPGYTAIFGGVFTKDGEKIDEAIALVFRAPFSYTGEDTVELSCHGGLIVMKRLLQAVFACGAEPAGPGEFTKRAFLNGKIGLTEAESVMQLISAQGVQASRTAIAGHEGALENRILSIRDLLIDSAAHLAAWADYPDDDVPQVDLPTLKIRLNQAEENLQKLLSQFDAGRAIMQGVNTVIAGRPNVGKSTLMNLLSGCERSIVTQYAGTTRDIVEDTIVLGDVVLHLADTAGIRATDDPVESIGVEMARKRVRCAQLVLAVFDASQELTQEDYDLIDDVKNVPAIAVINKTDLESKINEKYIKERFKQIVFISARSGDGINDLQQAAANVLQTSKLNPSEGMLYTERQRDDAEKALRYVRKAQEDLNLGVTLDAVTVSVESAVDALLELTGERATQAVVDSVFEQFCVGK